MTITQCFPTSIYRTEINAPLRLNAALEMMALDLAEADQAGQAWCRKHGYPGYTSYASITNLAEVSPPFRTLQRHIERHAALFARRLHWDLQGGKPAVDTLWVNILPPGGSHTSHIHTNAVLSGTYYVTVPKGAGAITFEDPRHALMMAAPPRSAKLPRYEQTYVTLAPSPGSLLLWESWLRHEVPMNQADEERISVSFNCVIS